MLIKPTDINVTATQTPEAKSTNIMTATIKPIVETSMG
jgi:hypothetical protein